MFKFIFTLSQSSRNYTRLCPKRPDTKTLFPCQKTTNRRSKNNIDTENKQRSTFKCVLLENNASFDIETSVFNFLGSSAQIFFIGI